MVEETTPKEFRPKKRLTRPQAIAVMVAGAVLIVVPWLINAEQGSALQLVKVGVGLVGFIALCVGAYLRP
jgi:hypothetical protein